MISEQVLKSITIAWVKASDWCGYCSKKHRQHTRKKDNTTTPHVAILLPTTTQKGEFVAVFELLARKEDSVLYLLFQNKY